MNQENLKVLDLLENSSSLVIEKNQNGEAKAKTKTHDSSCLVWQCAPCDCGFSKLVREQ